jgi:hypothetical protein
MFQLNPKTEILSAEQVDLPTGDFSRIQYAAVCFAPGRTPERWKDFPDGGGNWAGLPPEEARRMAEQLKSAIASGGVQELCLSFDSWGEDYFLYAGFAGGWAAMLYNACDECGAAPCDPDRPDAWEDAHADIGGQTPVPMACALEDLEKAGRIVLCFLETGKLSPETMWAVNRDGLPWDF